METVGWMVVYALSWIIHGSWPFIVNHVVKKKVLKIKEFWKRACLIYVIWITVIVICSGCPFSYFHQWLEVQAGWSKEINYKLKDSIAYKYVLHPLGWEAKK